MYTNDFLNEMRTQADPLADNLISYYFENAVRKVELRQIMAGLETNSDLIACREQPQMKILVDSASTLPVWAIKKSMLKGTLFFARYAQSITQLLGLLSLPFCYAAADGAQVLYLSEKIKNDPAKRLLDTAVFIWDVMAPDAFEPTGKGFSSILKIRLIHAAARYYTLAGKEWNDNWGRPINQEDMAGTNLALSFITVRGLRKLGISVAYAEQQHFIHLWNIIGSLSGINRTLLPDSGKEVNLLEESIRRRQFKTSAHGIALTKSLIDYFNTVEFGSKKVKSSFLPLMRFLLGDETADLLNVPKLNLSETDLFALKTLNFLKEFKTSSSFEYQVQKKNFDQFSKLVKTANLPG